MEAKITIRIYFEYGIKAKGLSLWQRIWDNSFSTELTRRAKSADLQQAICFNVTRGYLKHQSIRWDTEIRNPRYPQCIEITDSTEKVNDFLKKQDEFLRECSVLIVSNEVIIAIFKSKTTE